MPNSATVGIEAMAVHVPKYYLPLESLASANGIDPIKFTVGLGGRAIAIPHPNEDAVTMAVEASSALLKRYNVDRSRIGLLIVGSETGVDAAKPIAAYVHGFIGLHSMCRTFDTKHACYSATAALTLAREWCAGSGRGRKALVVATDIAQYDRGSPGEPTQGAGAVAMLVGDAAAAFVFDDFPEAFYTRHVMDFWRPNYRNTALVDGPASIKSYLEALRTTYASYEVQSGVPFNGYKHLLFHVPFPKMAFKAFKTLYEREASRRNGDGMPFPLDESFERCTAPALWANRELGNLYSGSLYLSLAGLLDRSGATVEGARVGLFSYGSGCCGEFFSGTVGACAAVWRGRTGLTEGLARRTALDHQGYLAFRETAATLAREGSFNAVLPGVEQTGAMAFLGIKNHQRVYGLVSAEHETAFIHTPPCEPSRTAPTPTA